jgi:hypothetical protein
MQERLMLVSGAVNGPRVHEGRGRESALLRAGFDRDPSQPGEFSNTRLAPDHRRRDGCHQIVMLQN